MEPRVRRMSDPFVDDIGKLVRSHSGMGGHEKFKHPPVATGRDSFHVVMEYAGKRLLRLPLLVFRRKLLYLVESEGQLDVHWLLRPQSSVVVERRYAILRLDEVGGTRFRNLLHAID